MRRGGETTKTFWWRKTTRVRDERRRRRRPRSRSSSSSFSHSKTRERAAVLLWLKVFLVFSRFEFCCWVFCAWSNTNTTTWLVGQRRAFESSSSSFRRSSASTKNVLNNARSHRRQSKMMMMMAMHSSKSSAASSSEDGRRRSVEEVVVSEEYRGEMMMSLEALKPSSSSLLSECSSNNTRRCAKNEFVQISKVSKAPNKAALEEDLSKLQLFGRKYWPALATLEFLALIGASLNGVLSRKRRLEIERLNIQMRAIMQRAEDERFEAKKTDGGSTSQAMGLIGKAKSTYASGEYDAAIALFQDALDAVKTASASGDDDVSEDSLSARKGLAMAYQASGDLTQAAAQLERALLIAKDSTVFGMLGDVYTDMGELAKAGDMYDKCLDAME
mmetsp:Transcript_6261/g.18569  ORF Transcript_6261/g.18569 Transcript_6261/m.18569 type:complete len:388 (+) Transcript_6261:4073-5236(+)